jgi:hypothetical protein
MIASHKEPIKPNYPRDLVASQVVRGKVPLGLIIGVRLQERRTLMDQWCFLKMKGILMAILKMGQDL